MSPQTDSDRPKRKYRRRTEEERIAELEARIQELKTKKVLRERREDPLFREIPKMRKKLQSFAQLAMDHKRPDIANSATAFSSSLERFLRDEVAQSANRATPPIEELE